MEKKPFSIRFDPHILLNVRSLARFERRSINEQVLFMLEKYINAFNAAQYSGPDEMDFEALGIEEDELEVAVQHDLEKDVQLQKELENSENDDPS
jgi:hypothetical protein